MSGVALAGPRQGRPSGMLGRWPIQNRTRSAGMTRGRPGKQRSRWSRRISARFQFGAAARPAISTWPATRSPRSVQVIDIFPSEGIIGDPDTSILFGGDGAISDGLRSGARLTFSHLFNDGRTYGDESRCVEIARGCEDVVLPTDPDRVVRTTLITVVEPVSACDGGVPDASGSDP